MPHDPGDRYLEVGDLFLFKETFPDQTDMVYTGLRHHGRYGDQCRLLTPWTLWSVLRDLKRGRYKVVVVHPPLYAAWHPRSFLTVLKRRPFTFPWALFSTFAFGFLRHVRNTPIVVTDLADSFGIGHHNFFLFDRCRAFFKRELPADNWLVFYRTGHRNLPTVSFRTKNRYQNYVDKLRPLSLGMLDRFVDKAVDESIQKQADVFFAGQTDRTTSVRSKGIRQLQRLKEQGVQVDIPAGPLPQDEYFRRCAASWLTWSPSGFGWDCFRHYESAVCGSVPVINMPTIERYKPLEHGRHCFLYPLEENGLADTVLEALHDKDRLKKMAQAAREHVLQFHTHTALCRHIIDVALEKDRH
jgi:glycosyltransferase involved in cell wall biosynthesis